ncbi:MAG: hypothetical protein NVS1B10_08310 [Candidatus Saccharimonadales bacterium]
MATKIRLQSQHEACMNNTEKPNAKMRWIEFIDSLKTEIFW